MIAAKIQILDMYRKQLKGEMILDNKQINELVSSGSEDWTEASGSESEIDEESRLLA